MSAGGAAGGGCLASVWQPGPALSEAAAPVRSARCLEWTRRLALMSSSGRRLWVVAAPLALLLLLALLGRPVHARPEARHCPNCVHPRSVPDARALETLRIEGIKQQILSKLGLRAKPNVTSSIPREVLLQTLYRSEEDRELLQKQREEQLRSGGHEQQLVDDDYYAKTSEIISFAEPGEAGRAGRQTGGGGEIECPGEGSEAGRLQGRSDRCAACEERRLGGRGRGGRGGKGGTDEGRERTGVCILGRDTLTFEGEGVKGRGGL